MRTLGEIQYGIKTDGPKAKLQVLEGALLVIEKVGFFDSDFAPGACVQCSQNEKKVWFVTFSETVIKVLEENVGAEPYIATLMSHQSASDRTYWTIE